MTTDLVDSSWDRIDAWLRERAPATFATLNGPATAGDIAAAESRLGVRFHGDLVASMRRHDGATGFQFPTHDRLLGVGEAVGATLFLRGIIAGDEDEDWGDYWRREFVKFGSYEVTADGLTVDCRAGGDGFGAVGRFFDESGTSFGHAGSLGAFLADVADSLEGGGAFQGDGAMPVVFNGALIWERAQAPDAGWGRADESLPGAEETLPALSLDRGEPRLRAVYIQGLGVLGALIATLPRERVAEAAVRQMCRLAAETGLAKYAEVAHALGSPPLPPAPDELFWANLRNPAIDTDWYADRYGRTTSKGTASNSSP